MSESKLHCKYLKIHCKIAGFITVYLVAVCNQGLITVCILSVPINDYVSGNFFRMISLSENVTVDEDGSAEFRCEIDANPMNKVRTM